ncbi:MAG: hypothetical protein OHK0012_14400 [Synechococcales cyanobacterium]
MVSQGQMTVAQTLSTPTTSTVSPQETAVLYAQLETAVAQKNWAVALDIVQTLLIVQPERALELRQYQQRLQQLSGSPPLPPLPSATPATVNRDDFVSQLRVQTVTGRVTKTRRENRSELGSRTVTTTPGCAVPTAVTISTEVTLPAEYEVSVAIQGPTGLPTQRVPITITIHDTYANPLTVSRDALLGSAATSVTKVTFTYRQIPRPRSVNVSILGGESRSFGLDVPAAATVLKRGVANIIPSRSLVSPLYCR